MGTRIGIRNPQSIKEIKNLLENEGILDKNRKIHALDGISYIYSTDSIEKTKSLLEPYLHEVEVFEETESTKPKLLGIQGAVAEIIGERSELLSTVPRKWSLYPPMVLFHGGHFDSPEWEEYFSKNGTEELFGHLLKTFFHEFTHFAVNQPIIESDVMRRPFNLKPLYGDFGPEPTDIMFENPSESDFEQAFWCSVVQNGIYQEWAPRYTMFSRGNITEKKRILDTFKNLEDQNVVDLYAGIGYFTFSYLANGATLFCWELNPWSIEGLLRGLRKNGCKFMLTRVNEPFTKEIYEEEIKNGTRAFVFHETNENAPTRLEPLNLHFSHYNLGLLPLLRQGWRVVQSIATCGKKNRLEAPSPKPDLPLVHAHENVHVSEFGSIKREIEDFFGEFVHIEKVKTFAPDVWHIVVDVRLGISSGPGTAG